MTDPELTWPSFKFAIWEAGPLPQEQNPIQIEGFAGGKGDPQFGYGRNPAMANPSWDPGIGPREVEHVRQSGNAKARGRDRTGRLGLPGRGRSGLRRAAPGADRQRHPARDREIPCLHRRGRIVGGDLLGTYRLSPGQSVTIDLDDGSGECLYDFKAVFDDGDEVVRPRIDVCVIEAYRYTEEQP